MIADHETPPLKRFSTAHTYPIPPASSQSLTASPSLDHSRFFPKRSFTFASLMRYLAQMLKYLPHLRAPSPPSSLSTATSRLSHAFQERIMMAVTSVNDCRYCSFFHSKMALEAGCSEEEIQSILGSEFSCADPAEIPALAFAQHYAESHEEPSRSALKQLMRYYDRVRTGQILMTCMMITMGNLLGNTVDAYESRLQGRPAAGGSTWFEGLIYYLSVRPMRRMLNSQKNVQ